MSIVERIKNDAEALAVIKDWLGDGFEPVPKELSEERASICALCPNNVHPDWWNHVEHVVATAIRAALDIRYEVGATTSKDDQLAMCRVCRCCSRLKVQVPMQHIRSHMDKDDLPKFPPFCWIAKEF